MQILTVNKCNCEVTVEHQIRVKTTLLIHKNFGNILAQDRYSNLCEVKLICSSNFQKLNIHFQKSEFRWKIQAHSFELTYLSHLSMRVPTVDKTDTILRPLYV